MLPAGREASLDVGALVYERHRPEQTLLYQIIDQHYPDFLSAMQAQGRPLPGYVQDEFEAFLQCSRLEYGLMGRVLGIVYRALATHIIHKAELTKSAAHTGSRFSSGRN